MRGLARLGGAAVLIVAGCGDGGSNGETAAASTGVPNPCVVGESERCTCANGASAFRVCVSSGEFGPCECPSLTTTGAPGGSTGGTDTGVICGDGVAESGEACDDGNDINDDACSNDCVERCGLQWTTSVSGESGSLVVADGAVTVLSYGADPLAALTRVGLADGGITDSIATQVGRPSDAGEYRARLYGEIVQAMGSYDFDGSLPSPHITQYNLNGTQRWHRAIADPLTFERFDFAVAPDGDIVAVASVEVAVGDTDVWVAKYDAETGSELWTTTHTGPNDGGLSEDVGGPVAVAEDGRVFVLAELQGDTVTLLRFGPDGGTSQWQDTVVVGTGNSDPQPNDVAVGPDGGVAASVTTPSEAVPGFTVVRYDEQQPLFRVDETMVETEPNPRPAQLGLFSDGSLFVAGDARPDADSADSVIWVAHFDPQGQPLCAQTLDVAGTSSQLILTADRALFTSALAEDSNISSVRPGF